MDRWAAADLLREVCTERFGSVEQAVAAGLALRYDGGPCFRSHHYQAEIDHLGIARSPAYHYEPETNGCVERFLGIVKEQVLWIERFETFEDLRAAVRAFGRTFNERWGGRPPPARSGHHRVEQALRGEHGQPAAVEAVALGLRADRGQELREGDDLGVVALGPKATGQAEAGRAGLVDDRGDPLAERAEPLEEDLGPGGLDPGGHQPAAVAGEGDTVGRLVDVDAHVHRLARLEAERFGGFPDEGELPRLGVGHGRYLRSGTSVSPTQVCLRTAPRPACYLLTGPYRPVGSLPAGPDFADGSYERFRTFVGKPPFSSGSAAGAGSAGEGSR